MSAYFENEAAEFWIKDGILYVKYKACSLLGISAAKSIVSDRLAFQAERSYPVLCDVRLIHDSDKTARDYLAKEGSALTSAVAFLVRPPLSNALAQFYIKANKPTIPTQVFCVEEEAMAFLRDFIL